MGGCGERSSTGGGGGEVVLVAMGAGLTEMFEDSSALIWLAIAAAGAVLLLFVLLFDRRKEKEKAEPPLPDPPALQPVSPNGKETAKLMLQAPDFEKAQALYVAFKTSMPAEDRMFSNFVNMAYQHCLDQVGKRQDADRFYKEVASLDEDSMNDSIEFAYLIEEAKE